MKTMPSITIGVNDFVKGVSTSNEIPDGGFSNLAKGQNLLYNIGTISSGCLGQDRSTNFVNSQQVVASVRDKGFLGNELYLVTDNGSNGASFFRWSSEAVDPTLEQTDSTANQYVEGKTDMIYFRGVTYVTSDRDITLLINNLATMDEDWWSTVGGTTTLYNQVPHSMIDFDNKLWIADAVSNGAEGTLHSFDGTTGVEDVINFGKYNTISALGRYETTGDMLIGTDSNANMSSRYAFQTKILVWDGFSPKQNREIFTEGRITAFYNLGGITYVFYGQNLGYFNGNGITFLRKLNIKNSYSDLIYPHKVTDANGTLYIVEGDSILAYGKLYSGGNRVFYYPHTQSLAPSGLTTIKHFGNGTNNTFISTTYVESGTADVKLNYIDLDNIETGSTFYSNKYYLPSNSIIKKVEIITDKLVASDNIGFELYKSSDESFTSIGTMEYSNDGAVAQKTLGKDKKIETSVAQIKTTWTAGIPSIKQIKIYYDAIEKEV